MRLKETIRVLKAIEERLSVNNIDNDPLLWVHIENCTHCQSVDTIRLKTTGIIELYSMATCSRKSNKDGLTLTSFNKHVHPWPTQDKGGINNED